MGFKYKAQVLRVMKWLFVGWLLLVLWGFTFAWRKVPEYNVVSPIALSVPVMSNAEYGELIDSHARPYLVDIETPAGGRVVIYGAEHTKDPGNTQIGEINTIWGEMQPTVALVESWLGILFPGLMDPVETFGEPGAVHALARQSNIPTYTWEPSVEQSISSLLEQGFSKEQVAMRTFLNPAFSSRRFGNAQQSEMLVEEALRKRQDWPHIGGIYESVQDLDAGWQALFPEGPDWRDVSDEYSLPGFLKEMDGNLVRDNHLVQVIVDLVERNERVFAVAGVSHAVKVEAALVAMLSADEP